MAHFKVALPRSRRAHGAISRSSFGLFSVFAIYEAKNFAEISVSLGATLSHLGTLLTVLKGDWSPVKVF